MIGRKVRRVPERPYRRFAELMWRLHLAETPSGNLEFVIHPWVASNEKVKRTLGWEPRHSSRETFEITMRTHGALDGSGGPAVGDAGVPAAA